MVVRLSLHTLVILYRQSPPKPLALGPILVCAKGGSTHEWIGRRALGRRDSGGIFAADTPSRSPGNPDFDECETCDIFQESGLTESDTGTELSNGTVDAMSLRIAISTLLESVQQFEALTKARLAERRQGADSADLIRAQLLRYGVCTCTCHFTKNTVHTGEPCCGNARTAKCRAAPKQSP